MYYLDSGIQLDACLEDHEYVKWLDPDPEVAAYPNKSDVVRSPYVNRILQRRQRCYKQLIQTDTTYGIHILTVLSGQKERKKRSMYQRTLRFFYTTDEE